MRIEKDTVVAFDYTLTDSSGQLLDSSEGREPLLYLHGTGAIIAGLERELEGREAGEQFTTSIASADAYGERNESLKQAVSRDQFEGVDDLEVGMQFRVDSNAGPMVVTVVEVGEQEVTIDGNHPLAGVDLTFDVSVREVRDATQEELDHGHAHGAGGHSH